MSLPPSKRGAVDQEGDSVPAFLRVGEKRPANLRGEDLTFAENWLRREGRHFLFTG
jgi:hypothetical protein